MADYALSGSDPLHALSQDVDGRAVASACVSECCNTVVCRLYWACNPCPRPNYDPNQLCSQNEPPEPFPACYIEQGIPCASLGTGAPIQPGMFVSINDWCYEVLVGDYYRPGSSNCPDTATPIPLSATCIIDYKPPDAPPGTIGVESLTCIEGCGPCEGVSPFAQANACGNSAIIWYYCRTKLTQPCVYRILPNGINNGASCFAFKASDPPLTFTPPDNLVVDPNPNTPGDTFGSCCECMRGGLLSDPCVWIYENTDAIGRPISPPLECCCGQESQASQATSTVTVFTYEQIAPSGGGTQRILVELVSPVSGTVGVTMAATLRQRIYLDDVLVQDITFGGDFTAPICGPYKFPFLNQVSDPDNPFTGSSVFDCNSASADIQRGSPSVLYERYTWSWNRSPPDVTTPCVGGCSGLRAQSRTTDPIAFRAL